MSLYSDLKEVYNDIKVDSFMRNIVRILGILVLIFFGVVIYKSLNEPITIFGIELNQSKVKHDTIHQLIHDTIYYSKSNSISKQESKRPIVTNGDNTNSFDQKGGQTANQINNNY